MKLFIDLPEVGVKRVKEEGDIFWDVIIDGIIEDSCRTKAEAIASLERIWKERYGRVS